MTIRLVLVLASMMVIAGLAFRVGKQRQLSDRRLGSNAILSFIMALISLATLVAVIFPRVWASGSSNALGAAIGLVLAASGWHAILAATVIGRFWRTPSNSAIAPDAQNAARG